MSHPYADQDAARGLQENLEENYAGVFDGRIGFGSAPVVITIDVLKGYTQDGYPFYSPMSVHVVPAIARLLRMAREKHVPIVHIASTTHRSGLDGGMMVRKAPSLKLFEEGADISRIDSALQVQPDELVLVKKGAASAFFGTNLAAMLTAIGRDTVILAGFSTSGCVRASAVDGIQHGFRVIVPRECCGDRHEAPHRANLFDIDAKYGDVVELNAVEAYLGNLR